jgi:alpha-ketoglutarate-dependent taurine dioxygenase
VLEIGSKDNVPKTARRVTANFVHPVVQTVDGREIVTDKIPFTISGPSIMGVDPEENERAVKRFFNLLADPDVQEQFISGYAAR